MQEFFTGYALNAIDAKNRVSVPAGYRDVVERRSDARVIVAAPHEREPCLIAYDRRHSATLAAQIERRFGDDFGPARDDALRVAFGATEQLPFDDNGRVVLSAMLKDLGELDRLAFFIAKGDVFEIWDPKVLKEAKGDDPRLMRILSRQMEARGEAL